MSKKKKKKKLGGKTSHRLTSLKDRKKRKVVQARRGLLVLLKIVLLVGVLGGVTVGLVFLDDYVKNRKNLDEKTFQKAEIKREYNYIKLLKMSIDVTVELSTKEEFLNAVDKADHNNDWYSLLLKEVMLKHTKDLLDGLS